MALRNDVATRLLLLGDMATHPEGGIKDEVWVWRPEQSIGSELQFQPLFPLQPYSLRAYVQGKETQSCDYIYSLPLVDNIWEAMKESQSCDFICPLPSR